METAMPMTHYPSGFAGGVSIRNVPVLNTHAGKVFWVDSNRGGDGNRGTVDRPLASLTKALSLADADSGTVIICKPKHAETITGAGGLAFNKAGVTVVGMGFGNQRPRFLMDGGTSVTALITAADTTLNNLRFAGGHNGITTCFGVTAVNATLEDIEIEDNTTDEHFLAIISATGADNTADGLTVRGLKWVTPDAGATDIISFTGSCNRLTVEDSFYCADAATGAGFVLCATGKVLTGLKFMRNVMICGNTSTDMFIDNDATTNTGVAAYNLLGCHDDAGVIMFDCDGIRQFENYQTSSDTASGLLDPVADVDT
jgi:hypothetical protein